mgnify:CR=1 FL=1
MKKTINYKNYDTKTSQLIWRMAKFLPKKVVSINKELYKTDKWQYFIHQFHENCMKLENYSYKKIFKQLYLVESDDIVKMLEDDFKDFTTEEYDKIVEEVKGVLAMG